ncbi:hypothetical protein RN001_003522 [Aquatica leii]|uniref:Uncharacterized protein n=1 Tax=Aquatica leii TaxID=1421715 RepID=A0AAN7SE21_9COLE|nr:hypothetical protein RN001_003522 [Aquatica leii]
MPPKTRFQTQTSVTAVPTVKNELVMEANSVVDATDLHKVESEGVVASGKTDLIYKTKITETVMSDYETCQFGRSKSSGPTLVTALGARKKSKKCDQTKSKKNSLEASLLSIASDLQLTHQNHEAIMNLNKTIVDVAQKISSSNDIKFSVNPTEIISNVNFCKHNNPESIVLFIESVEKILKIPNLHMPSFLTALIIKLDDHISEWWSSVANFPWHQIKITLCEKYINKADIIFLSDKFINRSQRVNESFETFTSDVRSKALALNLQYTEEHLVSLIWAHCNQETYDIIKYFSHPSNFTELDHIIIKIESIARRNQSFQHTVAPISSSSSLELRPSPANQRQSHSLYCRYCRNYGHIIDNCKKLRDRRNSYPKN